MTPTWKEWLCILAIAAGIVVLALWCGGAI